MLQVVNFLPWMVICGFMGAVLGQVTQPVRGLQALPGQAFMRRAPVQGLKGGGGGGGRGGGGGGALQV